MSSVRAAPARRAPAATVRATSVAAVVVAGALLRWGVGGSAPAASVPAALVFTAALATTAVVCGARFSPPGWQPVVLGVGGGVALVAVALTGLPAVVPGMRAAAASLAWWIPLVSLVAACEELVLRGVLFKALEDAAGPVAAVAVTAVLFAAIHLPLYGMQALPIDLCAGVFLGCLRVASGTVTAPLVAHAVADVATGFVG